jgi:spore coat polysaccharide biosynthesis protein SpsF
VIVVADNAEDHDFVRRFVPSDVPILFGQGADALSRFAKMLEQYPAEGVVRIRGDNLFIDPGVVDRLITTVESHPHCDCASYGSHSGEPMVLSPSNVYAEWFRSASLQKANRLAKAQDDREHVTRYFYTHPEQFELCWIPAPIGINREDVRLAVDVEEDWDHALAIYDALGPDHFDLHRITELLNHQPTLRSRMTALNRMHVKV